MTAPTTSLHPSRRRRERGVVLVISLLMLLVLTFIGLAATRSTTIEQRLTENHHDLAVAMQGAEAALRDGESSLNSAGLPDFSLNTAGAYTEASPMPIDWSNSAIWAEGSNATIQYQGGIGGTSTTPVPLQPVYKPRYYVVLTSHFGTSAGSSLSTDAPEPLLTYYYVVAHSYGLTTDTQVTLESTYLR